MTPTAAGFLATAAMVTVAGLVGVAAGRWQARREWAAHRGYTAVLERELAHVEAQVHWLRGQVTEAVHIIERHAPANLNTADGIQVWAMSPEFVERLRSNRRRN